MTANEITITNLSPDTEYIFKVRACAGSANGDWSSELTITTDAEEAEEVEVELINLALRATATSDSIANNSSKAEKAIDGDPSSRWIAGAGVTSCYLELQFPEAVTYNHIKINEFATRIDEFALQVWDGNEWVDIYTGKGIGANFEADFPAVTSPHLRLMIHTTKGTQPSIYEFEVYNK